MELGLGFGVLLGLREAEAGERAREEDEHRGGEAARGRVEAQQREVADLVRVRVRLRLRLRLRVRAG